MTDFLALELVLGGGAEDAGSSAQLHPQNQRVSRVLIQETSMLLENLIPSTDFADSPLESPRESESSDAIMLVQ